MNADASGESEDPMNRDTEARWWTIPNLLGAIRLGGSPALLILAWLEWPLPFLVVFLALAMTDWVDGKLAIWLNQRSIFGARLDSAADATLYAATLVGCLWMRWHDLQDEIPWLAAAVASYAITSGAGLWKFGRWPSYHTRGAKASWLFVFIATIALLLDWSMLPIRFAAVFVILTNIEATLITFVMPRWEADVPTLYHAWQRAQRTPDAGS